MEIVNTNFQIIRAAFLIAGTTIGAGMLGIPLITAACGFYPALLMTFGVWAFMLLTGLLLLEVSLNMPEGASFLSLASRYMGTFGVAITGGLFVFLYYSLMVAYVAAGGLLLGNFLGINANIAPLIFCLIFGCIVAKGPKSIDKVNFFMTVLMGAIWIALFTLGVKSVEPSRFHMKGISTMMVMMPVLFSSFGYHNIIPSLTTYLKKDKAALRSSIILGTTIPLVVYSLWQWLIIGAVSPELLSLAYEKGLPVTVLLKEATGSSLIMSVGNLFAFFAISTSVLGVSFSLVDFLADGFKAKKTKMVRIALTFSTFFPALFFTWLNAEIFEKSLGIAGGFGEACINGMIPVAFVFIARYYYKERANELVGGGKWLLVSLFLFSILAFVVEAFHLVS